MRRRDLLLLGAATAGVFATRRALAQVAPDPTRAAIVIGVNRTSSLPELRAAVSGANAIGDWLEDEGFGVTRFLDDNGPVTSAPIKAKIRELVDRGTLEQLVIYFAGHGFKIGFSEHWMLSLAPDDLNEAFSLVESVDLAGQTGIPNVVLISDACCSAPPNLGISQVRGVFLFPRGMPSGNVKVDKFIATLPGSPAFETAVDVTAGEYEGIYTSCFLQAFKTPDDEMIQILPDGRKVIPNRNLEAYLRREVPRRAREANKTLEQIPDSFVLSSPPTFIGRVAEIRPDPLPMAPPPVATIHDVLPRQLDAIRAFPTIVAPPVDPELAAIDAVAETSGFNRARDAIIAAASLQPQTQLHDGLTISGIGVEEVASAEGVRTELIVVDNVTTIGVEIDGSAASVAIRFTDGTGTVVPALRGFNANVTVYNGGVSNISYDIGGGSPDSYLTELRAVVATAAKFGVFRIEGDGEERADNARRLGDIVRMGKGADPTLGLYAAYAYNEGNFEEDLDSVDQIMRSNLNALLFDVALLAGDLSSQAMPDHVFPFCPMLSQGWAYLRVRDVTLAETVASLRDHLRPALWTTFDSEGVDIAFNALRSGSVR